MLFVPYEFPKTADGHYLVLQMDKDVLRSRREQLSMTQQQVADRAHIQLKQYQRLESGERTLSGCSMRIGLAVSAVLLLDPYDLLGVQIEQPDPKSMKPQRQADIRIREI